MIRLLSVIGHGIKLVPHFIEHYSGMVDRIELVVYESELYPNLTEEIKKEIRGRKNVKIVESVYDRIFDWNRVTDLYNKHTSKRPNDWWVIADVDEFHLYSESLSDIKYDCEENGWEIVRGGFIDRIGIDGGFPELKPDLPIFDQFPMAGFFRYPMSGACPNKVCFVKGNVEITPGQHYAKILGQTTWRWQGWNHPLIAPVEKYSVQVHHFKWDSTCLERIKDVAEVKKDYSFSDEYKLMYDTIIKEGSKIDTSKEEYMFEFGVSYYEDYRNWNKLLKKIISI